MKKSYDREIAFIRVLACIAVLFYHLGLLKGGYLAVCTFFVLSGYLSIVSLFRKDHFSFIDYYKKRILKLYIPLVIVVFVSITVISFLPQITWLNLKPETTSILFGYNNFWQLGANLDYFTRHVNSPFMHLWYLSILLQFDLVLPFLYLGLKKLGESVRKIVPCILLFVLILLSGGFFYYYSVTGNIMIPYYHSFTRVFSLLLGVLVGLIHHYYAPLVTNGSTLRKGIFTFYVFVMIALFFFVDAQSSYHAISMILISLISARVIDYGVCIEAKSSFADSLLQGISSITYEIYLVQYPILFIIQSFDLSFGAHTILVIVLTVLCSFLLSISLRKKKRGICGILQWILLVCFIGLSFYGGYQYIVSKDHTLEMKALEDSMAENQKMIDAKNEAYLRNLKEQENQVMASLKELEMSEEELSQFVSSLPIIGVGDSVMLGAVPSLYQTFPNGYFDAKVSRTAWVVAGILRDLDAKGMLKEPIILNLGANGDCTLDCKEDIMRVVGNRQVFWVNVTNNQDVHVNEGLVEFSKQHSNLHIVDWNTVSLFHRDYFVADGIHLTEVGMKAYSQLIYQSIYDYYLEDIAQKKEEIKRHHEESLKADISFYGNDLLVNASSLLEEKFPRAQLIAKSDFTRDRFLEELRLSKENGTCAKKIVLLFDRLLSFQKEEYQSIFDICSNEEIYVVTMNRKQEEILQSFPSIHVVSFQDNSAYLMADGIHLTKEGNEILLQRLEETIGLEK